MSDSIHSPSTTATALANPTTADTSPSGVTEGTDWLHILPKSGGLSQYLIWLMTLLSLALHLSLMFLPMSGEKQAIPVKPEEKKVRITQLPTTTKRVAVPSAQVKPLPIAAALRRTTPVRSTIPSLKPPLPPVPPPLVSAPASVPTPAPASSVVPTAPVEVVGSNANPWQDFPQYPNAQSGCYNLPSCRQTDKPLAEVSAYFAKELAAKKYSANLTIQAGDRQVYQVSRDGVAQFLSILSAPGKGTVYVLAEAPRTLADLGDAIEVPTEIYSVLLGLAAEDAARANFAQPDAFYTANALHPTIGVAKLVPGESPETFFDTYFRTNLVNSGFEPTDTMQQYGGGLVYLVKKEDLTLYINLVPTQDGRGTIVVVWKGEPQ